MQSYQIQLTEVCKQAISERVQHAQVPKAGLKDVFKAHTQSEVNRTLREFRN